MPNIRPPLCAGQEWVWDYPRPPRVEPSAAHIVVTLDGHVIADTRRSLRVLETSHPPVHYLPPGDVHAALARTPRRTVCEFKGEAVYQATSDGRELGWSYPHPSPGYAQLRDHVAFYPGRVDSITLDGEPVASQAGGFYGGWVTAKIVGPFKGEPGSSHW